MNREELGTALKKFISEVSLKEVELNTQLLDDEVIDSFTILAIINQLEEMLEIELEPEQVSIKYFASVATLVEWALSLGTT